MIGIPTPPSAPPTLRSMWSDCLRYWEPRRVVYNGILLAVVLTQLSGNKAWSCMAHPHAIVGMIIACALANLCYCTAYAVDLAVQHSDFREAWLERRGWLFFVGCILAGALTTLTLPLVLSGLL